ncbi:hypothetical protein PPERSA_01342 [Pseudocohnilembus persalinus]|uniref:TLDc domain-containing protein n=1 Tax=Pseudocohnilembus persalinus TaxID=266149 RepID=A0A0V0QGW1_PSEPJ|nr:hypothetical protein PPERSA_01342 [Pseudocohnilembus persalinus]|eukprot:KRX01439.1 hypothetical protein PPERSA_01342 [Pseudocohnilembus persalinus]
MSNQNFKHCYEQICPIKGHIDNLEKICINQVCKHYLEPICQECEKSNLHQHEKKQKKVQFIELESFFQGFQTEYNKQLSNIKTDQKSHQNWSIIGQQCKIMADSLISISEIIDKKKQEAKENVQKIEEILRLIKNQENTEKKYFQSHFVSEGIQEIRKWILQCQKKKNAKFKIELKNMNFFEKYMRQYEKISDSLSQTNYLVNNLAKIFHQKTFLDSQILKDNDIINQINQIIEQKGYQWNYSQIYSSQKDGLSMQKFHEKCDDSGPNLVLIETYQEKIWGGVSFENSWISVEECENELESSSDSKNKSKVNQNQFQRSETYEDIGQQISSKYYYSSQQSEDKLPFIFEEVEKDVEKVQQQQNLQIQYNQERTSIDKQNKKYQKSIKKYILDAKYKNEAFGNGSDLGPSYGQSLFVKDGKLFLKKNSQYLKKNEGETECYDIYNIEVFQLYPMLN